MKNNDNNSFQWFNKLIQYCANNFKSLWTKELVQQHLDNKNYQKLNMKDEHGNTGFMTACVHQPELAKIMLKKDNIDFNIQDNVGYTGFIWTCINQPELAKIMLKKDNIDFNIQDKYGRTGFILACEKHPELLNTMLNNKHIDKELRNQNGLTGYDIAKKKNQESFEIYQAWLEKDNIKKQQLSNKSKISRKFL